MSNPSEIGENRKLFSGQQLGKALEKSNFAQTCTLLSQFLRGKRNLGDARSAMMMESRDQDPKALKTTCNLLTKIENSIDNIKQNRVPTTEFLPQFVGSGSTASIDNLPNEVDFRKPANPEPAATAQNQMTIFYGGKVLVFNDFPADKAEEIMTMATNNTSTATKRETKSTDEHAQRQPQANATDMPIARRNSLHRFLEKRKDRATAAAPYQVNPPPQLVAWSSSKNDMSSESIDLNL